MPRRSSKQLGLGEQQRQHGEALLALRAEGTQVAARRRARRGRRDADPAPVVPRSRSRSTRASSCSDCRRLALVAKLRPGQAELARALGEVRLQRRQRSRASRPRARRRKRLDLLVPGRKCLPCREDPGRLAERRVSLTDRRTVLGREPRASTARAVPMHAVEVRPPSGRPALDDHQAVGREDERRHLTAQLLGCAQTCAVQGRPLPAADLQRHLEIERNPRPAHRARRCAPRRGRSGPAARRPASAARSPASPRAATPAGWSCRLRSARSRARGPAPNSRSSFE